MWIFAYEKILMSYKILFVLVSFLLLWRDIINKALFLNNKLGPCFYFPEGESRTIMVGSMAAGWQRAGRHRNRAAAESLHIIYKREAERMRLGLVYAFETSKPTPSDKPPPSRPCFLIFPQTVSTH